MVSILFDGVTSIRRALILALGTYSPSEMSPGDREPLVSKLLGVYKADPDSGIHGATEWTLRQWHEQVRLEAAERGLPNLGERGSRRWFVNGQGQTFALIEGPVVAAMGSPPTEPQRGPDEVPFQRRISRRFAIASKEVTVAQFQRFLKHAGIADTRYHVSADELLKFSPDDDGPWIRPEWYAAAHYCNWLSEQEGLPEHEWCYVPSRSGDYAEGMTIPANVLKRKGYRLPTEAEWEYACRAGTTTARYYGFSVELLGSYAEFQYNHKHAISTGRLLPNDLGLFDMTGNAFEWCQDRAEGLRAHGGPPDEDSITREEVLLDKDNRMLRGGAFSHSAEYVRSAILDWSVPTARSVAYGFRVARSY
jgi:formylglycine-generating enzyme required for sulfatase activity